MEVVETLYEVVPLMAPKHVTLWAWASFFSMVLECWWLRGGCKCGCRVG